MDIQHMHNPEVRQHQKQTEPKTCSCWTTPFSPDKLREMLLVEYELRGEGYMPEERADLIVDYSVLHGVTV